MLFSLKNFLMVLISNIWFNCLKKMLALNVMLMHSFDRLLTCLSCVTLTLYFSWTKVMMLEKKVFEASSATNMRKIKNCYLRLVKFKKLSCLSS